MSALAVTLTIEQLEELVAKTIRNELAKASSSPVKEVFSLTEAAAFLGRHPRQVTRLIREGTLPAHYISDREPRFRRSELLDWLASLPAQSKTPDP